MYPKDCTFLSNIAAVQLSGLKDYDACIATCEKALATAAKGNAQDFKVMARLYGRMGNAWRLKGDENLGKAIESFDKAVGVFV